jgi:hypothetical protein
MRLANALKQFWVGFRSRHNEEKIRAKYRENVWLVDYIQGQKSKTRFPLAKAKAIYYWEDFKELAENVGIAILTGLGFLMFISMCIMILYMASKGIRVQVIN